jgi:hypothetical protein
MSWQSRPSICVVAALIAAVVQLPAAAAQEIRLSGCLVRGEDGDGYLLTNAPGEPAWQSTADGNVAPGAVGTTGAFATVFYWLDDDDELADNVGRLVEIDGELEGDLEDGQIKIERKDDWTEIEVESDGDHLKARVPHSSIVAAPGPDERRARVLVRKVDVENVRMVSATCGR